MKWPAKSGPRKARFLSWPWLRAILSRLQREVRLLRFRRLASSMPKAASSRPGPKALPREVEPMAQLQPESPAALAVEAGLFTVELPPLPPSADPLDDEEGLPPLLGLVLAEVLAPPEADDPPLAVLTLPPRLEEPPAAEIVVPPLAPAPPEMAELVLPPVVVLEVLPVTPPATLPPAPPVIVLPPLLVPPPVAAVVPPRAPPVPVFPAVPVAPPAPVVPPVPAPPPVPKSLSNATPSKGTTTTLVP
jgi:hypothetical protein